VPVFDSRIVPPRQLVMSSFFHFFEHKGAADAAMLPAQVSVPSVSLQEAHTDFFLRRHRAGQRHALHTPANAAPIAFALISHSF